MFVKRNTKAYRGGCRLFYIPNLIYRITYRRLALGLTVVDLADRMDINMSYVYRVLAGKVEPISERVIMRFAKVLGKLGDPVPGEPAINFTLDVIKPPNYLVTQHEPTHPVVL